MPRSRRRAAFVGEGSALLRVGVAGGLRPPLPNSMHHQLPDYLRPGLMVVFVGFNPSKRAAEIGHYYAGKGNQFWNFLFESGLTRVRLGPEEDHRVLEFDIGLTDVVKRWSRSANGLRQREYELESPKLEEKIEQCSPWVVAFNGKGAYEGFRGRGAERGWQKEKIAGSRVFVLPATSGADTSMTRVEKLRYFRRLARWLKAQNEDDDAR